jgi:hypothetical protein
VDDITDRKKAEEELLRSKDELEERVRERTAALTQLLGELEKSRNNLRKLAGELVMAEERERKRIAVALHDEIAQTLAAAKMRADLLRNLAGSDESRTVAEELRGLLAQAIGETRTLMTGISSPILYELGLESALQSLAEKTTELDGIRVSCSPRGALADLQAELAVMVYQTAKELVQNVVKHSRARNASIQIGREGGARPGCRGRRRQGVRCRRRRLPRDGRRFRALQHPREGGVPAGGRADRIRAGERDAGGGYDPRSAGPREGTLRREGGRCRLRTSHHRLPHQKSGA